MDTSRENFEIGRRGFMATALAGAAAIVCPLPGAAAARRDGPAFRFLIVSDTHVGRKDNDGAERAWAATAAELRQAPGDFVLHLGDLIDGAREEQYPIYKRIRDSIGKPVYEIPGNHDPAAMFARHIRPEIDMALVHHGVRFLLLDNTDPESPEEHDGFIRPQQLAWIEEQCAAAAVDGELVVVCAHIPVHTNNPPDRAWYVKPGSGQRRFYSVMEKHSGHVFGLLHGHFHNGIRGWADNGRLHEVLLPSALYNQDRDLERRGAPGYNLPDFRPGYVLAEITAAHLTLQYKPLGESPSVSRTYALTVQS